VECDVEGYKVMVRDMRWMVRDGGWMIDGREVTEEEIMCKEY
jgi:hypothetical protein